jgi:hypothetical protein
MRRSSLVAVVLLLALAGCSAVLPGGGADTGTTPTATPAPIPVGDGASLPPGVDPERLNATVLARTTARQVEGETVRFEFDEREARPEFSLGTVYVGPRVTVESVATDRYSVRVEQVSERGGGLMVATFQNATYVTPDGAFRYDGANLTAVAADGREGRPSRLVARYVDTFLDVERASVRQLPNGSVLVEGEGGRTVNGTDYSVSALVGSDGVVRRFEAIYTRDEQVQFATFTLEERDVFRPPEWYDPANVTHTPTAVPTERTESATGAPNATATP